jgi:hypothetical protein
MIRRLATPALLAGAALSFALTGARVATADALDDCVRANEDSLQSRADHKLRKARAQSLACAAESCPADMRDKCKQRVEQLNAAIPTIVFIVQDASGSGLSAVKVSMDGALLVDRLEGTAIALDPGEHKFTFEVARQPPVEKTFLVNESEKERRERIVLGEPPQVPLQLPVAASATTAVPAAPAASTTATPAETPPTPDAAPAHGGSSFKTVGLVTGGVGILGLGAGAVFGLEALSKKNDANCASDGACSSQGAVTTQRDAQNAGNLSTVFFIAGGVLAAAGITMFALAPSSTAQVTPSVGTNEAGVVLRGAW